MRWFSLLPTVLLGLSTRVPAIGPVTPDVHPMVL